jgi:hypothetical protein
MKLALQTFTCISLVLGEWFFSSLIRPTTFSSRAGVLVVRYFSMNCTRSSDSLGMRSLSSADYWESLRDDHPLLTSSSLRSLFSDRFSLNNFFFGAALKPLTREKLLLMVLVGVLMLLEKLDRRSPLASCLSALDMLSFFSCLRSCAAICTLNASPRAASSF